jgi:mannose-6-phosphate isomerase-like protein (cupin superfamily)/quercetin dioxygenase-like cupin family protein
MGTVTEQLCTIGSDKPVRTLEREEALLLGQRHPGGIPVKGMNEREPLAVVHYPQQYAAQPFAPPRGIYESDQLRVEWQTMDNRQPFYHRNCDVDEISYQIAGDRTLMTELGVVEHRPGELSCIPRGVAHDNYGRRESHLLFYVPAPVAEEHAPVRDSKPIFPPFPGWQAGKVNEAVTQCLGAIGHDIAVFPADEQLLLGHVETTAERLHVLRTGGGPGVRWFYRTPSFRLGSVLLPAGEGGTTYRRNLDADEVQYQISGRRTLVSQHGLVELGPGDFVRVPLGVACTSIADEETRYLTLLSDRVLPQVGETSRVAVVCTPEAVATARGTMPTSRP